MSGLSDDAINHLRELGGRPELPGDRFEIGELLGQGGMGAVYRVRDRTLERDVALKVLRAELGTTEGMERLERESRILAKLAHPGIVPIHDVGNLVDGRPCYLMRLVGGHRLDQLPALTHLPERMRLFLRICETVEFAHRHEVIHCDLKPSNVMVGEFGEVLVLDWGIARLSTAPESLALGTPGFMAPEQLRGVAADIDQRSDVYALGAILRSLVEGMEPARPRQLGAIISRAMASAREQRYASVRDLALDLTRYLDGDSVSAYRESSLDRLQRIYGRYQVPILLVVAYLVMRLLFLVFRRQG